MNSRTICVVAIAGLIACGTLQAGNLLVNPEFDQAESLVGWTWALDTAGGKASVCGTDSTCGAMHFSAAECCDRPASGSVSSDSSFFYAEVLEQCVTGIVAGNPYDFGAWIRLTTASGFEPGLPGIGILWYPTTDCSGAQTSGETSFTGAAVWSRVGIPANIAPAGTLSAKFLLIAGQTGDAGTSVGMEFDGAFFGPSGTVPVELQSFEVD